MLSFTFLGTASGVPTRQRNVSGLAVRTSNFSARYHDAAALAPLAAEARAQFGGALWLANDFDHFALDEAGVLRLRGADGLPGNCSE